MVGAVARLKPLVQRLIHLGALAARPMTLGVRIVVADGEGRILLVRHTYVPGWYLPGGGVDPGETLAAAAAREVGEEAGIRLEEPARLFALYFNRRASRRDHVGLYVCNGWSQPEPPKVPNREIAEIGFFSRNALPEETTAATRRRLAEVFEGAAVDEIW